MRKVCPTPGLRSKALHRICIYPLFVKLTSNLGLTHNVCILDSACQSRFSSTRLISYLKSIFARVNLSSSHPRLQKVSICCVPNKNVGSYLRPRQPRGPRLKGWLASSSSILLSPCHLSGSKTRGFSKLEADRQAAIGLVETIVFPDVSAALY